MLEIKNVYKTFNAGTVNEKVALKGLDLTLEEYLEWLHEKGMLAVQEDGRLKYLILCKPLSGTHVAFDLPQEAAVEASFDNDGYAIVACTFEES